MITHGFDSAGITEAVARANDVKVEVPFIQVMFSNSCTLTMNTLSQFFENIQFWILSIDHYSQHCYVNFYACTKLPAYQIGLSMQKGYMLFTCSICVGEIHDDILENCTSEAKYDELIQLQAKCKKT